MCNSEVFAKKEGEEFKAIVDKLVELLLRLEYDIGRSIST